MWIKIFQILIVLIKSWFSKKDNTNEKVYEEIKNTPPVVEVSKPEVKPVIQEPVVTTALKIIQNFLPPNQYVQDSKFVLNQVYLHHTAGSSAKSTIEYWSSNKERVSTHYIIDRDGTVIQCIPLEKAWGYHLYVGSPGNKIDRSYKKLGSKYDAQSIGIELANFGYVNFVDGKFVNYVGKLIHHDRVVKLDKPCKGYYYWEDYTKEQVESLEKLLIHLLNEYPQLQQGLKEDYSNLDQISFDALNMKPGIYGHQQVRTDKFDVFPSPRLIEMLNNLKNNVVV